VALLTGQWRTFFSRHWLLIGLVAFAGAIVGLAVFGAVSDDFQLALGTVGEWVPGLAILIAIDQLIRERRAQRIRDLEREIAALEPQVLDLSLTLQAMENTRKRLAEQPLVMDADGHLASELVRLAATRMGLVGSSYPYGDRDVSAIPDAAMRQRTMEIVDVVKSLDALAPDPFTDDPPGDPEALLDTLTRLRNDLERFARDFPDALRHRDQLRLERAQAELERLYASPH
jgi:hypothetical protein